MAIMHEAGHFHLAYDKLLAELVGSPLVEQNRRTGQAIKVLAGAASLKVDLRDNRLPVCGHRKLYPKTAAAEVAWFVSGTRNADWMRKQAPIWDKFVEEDGTVWAGYGYRWRTHFHRDQLHDAVAALVEDHTNRRVYVSAWDPGVDGLDRKGQRNVPCPVGFTLSIVEGQLHSSLLLRSSDVFVGLPYDIMGHSILMRAFADTINARDRASRKLTLGSMHFTLAHPHLYAPHWSMAEEALSRQQVFEKPEMQTGWDFERIEADKDGFVQAYKAAADAVKWPDFTCRPEVVA